MSRLKNFQSKVELDEYTFMWQTHLFDLPYLPISQKCFSLLGNITQTKELKKKEFLKTLLDVILSFLGFFQQNVVFFLNFWKVVLVVNA